jgi:hypothetical protein
MKTDKFIERRILTGLIISTEYIQRVRRIWDIKLLQAPVARRVAEWCIIFFDKYDEAPAKEIESIFRKESKKLKKEEAEDIEDILSDLSEEYERKKKFNVDYLYDQTIQYFDEVHLRDFAESVLDDVDRGKLTEAKSNIGNYSTPTATLDDYLDLSDPLQLEEAIDRAFASIGDPLFRFPRALGEFMNDKLMRGGFMAFMAPEKRGKTFWLLYLAMTAARQRVNVAFFQAGDMNQEEQLMRVCVHLTKRPNKKKYCGTFYQPVRDCIKNQLDDCNLKQRECDFGIFDDKDERFVRSNARKSDLLEQLKEYPDYKPCYNCDKFWKKKYGAPWLKKINVGEDPLTKEDAYKVAKKFFVKNSRRFRLSTHPNSSLTVSEIKNILDLWERQDGFVADLIIVDYADILAPEITGDFRHQENDKWKKLRGLSQERKALVVTVTQTDADSYDQNTLGLKNYSEDKRKFGHVTAMFGLNQDKEGREKEIGIMRINEIVIREGEFSKLNQVHLLQNLRIGQPCLASYW